MSEYALVCERSFLITTISSYRQNLRKPIDADNNLQLLRFRDCAQIVSAGPDLPLCNLYIRLR